MKHLSFVLLLAGLSAASLCPQSVFLPGNGGPVAQQLTNVNPTTANSGPCLASVTMYQYVTGHTWGCVGAAGSMAWTDLTALASGGGLSPQANNTVLGNNSGSSAIPSALSVANLNALLATVPATPSTFGVVEPDGVTVSSTSGTLAATGVQTVFVANVNQSTGAATCNFAPINGAIPACFINDQFSGTSKNPVLPSFSNLPASATATNPILLHIYFDMYQTTGVTWPTGATPRVWCGGIDQLYECGLPGSQNWWSYQSPTRTGNATNPNAYFHMTLVYNGTDLYVQGDSGQFQTVQAAHVNTNTLGIVTLSGSNGTNSGPGTINMLFGGVENLGQGSYLSAQSGPIAQYGIGTAIAAASTIAPTFAVTHVTGTTAVATITVPSSTAVCTTAGYACQITLIPDGAFTTTTAGNIALASTAVVSKALTMTYDATAAKWYPSY